MGLQAAQDTAVSEQHMWNAPGEGEGRGGGREKELRKLSIISDYKENVGQDRTSQLWAVTRKKSYPMEKRWDWRVRIGR